MGKRVPHLSTPWTDEEDSALMSGYVKHGPKWEGWKMILPGRTPSSIRSRAYRLGLRMRDTRVSLVYDSLEGVDERAITAIAALSDWNRTRLRLLMEVA